MTQPEAPFEAPWQAQLFALTVALNEAGHFTWPDWAAKFGPLVQNAPAQAYWHIWGDALVALLEDLQIAEAQEVRDLTARWIEAERNTPHGQPITLENAGYTAPVYSPRAG